jgi:hypothetical protein
MRLGERLLIALTVTWYGLIALVLIAGVIIALTNGVPDFPSGDRPARLITDTPSHNCWTEICHDDYQDFVDDYRAQP